MLQSWPLHYGEGPNQQLDRPGHVRAGSGVVVVDTKHGKKLVVVQDDASFLAVVDPKTGEKYCHGILVDITQRKELQTQLLEYPGTAPVRPVGTVRGTTYLLARNTLSDALVARVAGQVGAPAWKSGFALLAL